MNTFTPEQNKKMAEIARTSFSAQSAKETAKISNLQQKITAEIWKKQQERIKRNHSFSKTPYSTRIKNLYLSHVDMGCTGREGHRAKNSNYNTKVIRSGKGLLALVKLDGWVQYSRTVGYFVNRAWLVGKDKNTGWFSIQVPSKINNVDEALEYIKPVAVKKAEKEGRKVYQRGNVYFVEMKRNCRIGDVPAEYRVEKNTYGYLVEHPEHLYLLLKGRNWKAYVQKSVKGKVTD